MEFELAYYDVAVQHVNHYSMRTSPSNNWVNMLTTKIETLSVCLKKTKQKKTYHSLWVGFTALLGYLMLKSTFFLLLAITWF